MLLKVVRQQKTKKRFFSFFDSHFRAFNLDNVASKGKRFHLLQEGDQLASSPFVRFGQIEVLQVQHQSLAVLWSVNAASVGADDHARLLEFLKHVHGRSLGTTMHHSYLGRAELLKTVP